MKITHVAFVVRGNVCTTQLENGNLVWLAGTQTVHHMQKTLVMPTKDAYHLYECNGAIVGKC